MDELNDILIVAGPTSRLQEFQDRVVRLPKRPWEVVSILQLEGGAVHSVAILRPWSPLYKILGRESADIEELRRAERFGAAMLSALAGTGDDDGC